MENLNNHPQSVLNQILRVHFPDEGQYRDQRGRYVIVVDAKSNMPQYFYPDINGKGHGQGGLGCFIDAYPINAEGEVMPTCIYDIDTAQYLIGQDAIYNSMCPDHYKDDANSASIFRLIPVWGAILPGCLPQKTAQ